MNDSEVQIKVVEDSQGRRVYEVGDISYPSVTTILDAAYPRPHLAAWASTETAREALANRHVGMSEQAAFTYLQRTPFRTMRLAGHRGTEVHDAIDRTLSPMLSGQKPVWWKEPKIAGYMDAARAFCNDNLSGISQLESAVFNDTYRYAGRVDMWAVSKNGQRILVDWKTGKQVYPDHALQLAAYAGAEWMITAETRIALEKPAAGAVVRLDAEGNYEAKWIGSEKLNEYLERFIRLIELKDFISKPTDVWDAVRKGVSA